MTKLETALELLRDACDEDVSYRILRNKTICVRPKSAGYADNPSKPCFGDIAEPMTEAKLLSFAKMYHRATKAGQHEARYGRKSAKANVAVTATKAEMTSQDGFTDPHGIRVGRMFRPALEPDVAAALKATNGLLGIDVKAQKHVLGFLFPVLGSKRERYAELVDKLKEFRKRYSEYYTKSMHEYAARNGIEAKTGQDKKLDATYLYIKDRLRVLGYVIESVTKLARLRRIPAPTKTATATASGQVNNIGIEGKKILRYLQAQHSAGSKEQFIKEFVAGRAWTDLKRIPKPVDNSFELCRKLGLIKAEGRGDKRVFVLTSDGRDVLNSMSKDETATASNDIADVRRVRDNKLVKSLRDEISNDRLNDRAGAFIKELVRIASEEQLRNGEPCYIYWRNTKYLPDFKNQTLKTAGTGARRFAESV
jgi:hypothetical protein